MEYLKQQGLAIEPPSYIIIDGTCMVCGKDETKHVAVYVTIDTESISLEKMGLKECSYEAGGGPHGDWARFVCYKMEKKPDTMDLEEFEELYTE